MRSSVKVGTRTLATYTYTNDKKNYLQKLAYGNGDSVQYTYDTQGRVTKETYEDGSTVTYKYDNSGALATVTDSQSGITTTYYYDFIDRMMKYVESGNNYSHSVGYEYDTINNLTKLVETINGTKHTTSYTYDDDNRVSTIDTDGKSVSYIYDTYGRVQQMITEDDAEMYISEYFRYRTPTTSTTTGQVAAFGYDTPLFGTSYEYTYDDNGNILSVTEGAYTTSYVYDTANQLVRENNQKQRYTYTWTYDDAGNILSRSKYAYTTGTLGTATETVSYAYTDSDWGDLLTSYNGKTITYDAVGNPLSDGTYTYTWQHGRQLASVTSGSTTYHFTYNADGLRTKCTYGNDVIEYFYNGSQLSRMNYNGTVLDFTYDANGTPVSVSMDGAVYYYLTNLQGDVTRIIDSSGNDVGMYTYTAWGACSDAGNDSITIINPLRYRGYVYDFVTGFYYLQSRYYNPKTGRFINADGLIVTGGLLGNNMYAYCRNNPINFSDSNGNMPYYANDPAGEAGRKIGEWLHKWITGKIEEDKSKVEDGTVVYNSNGKDKGVEIENSYQITTPQVMYEVVSENRGDEIAGTTTGVVAEWIFHNIAYKLGEILNSKKLTEPAKHLDVGKTIYSDRRNGFIMSMMSLSMQVAYTLISPVTAAYDLGMETGRWDHVQWRE